MPVTPTARTGLRLRRLLDPPGEDAQATGAFLQRVGWTCPGLVDTLS